MLAPVRLLGVQLRLAELNGALEVVVDDLCSLVEECDARPVSRNLLLHLCQLDLFVGVDAPRTIREAHQVLQALIEHQVLRLLDCRLELELGLTRLCFRLLLAYLRRLIGEG